MSTVFWKIIHFCCIFIHIGRERAVFCALYTKKWANQCARKQKTDARARLLCEYFVHTTAHKMNNLRDFANILVNIHIDYARAVALWGAGVGLPWRFRAIFHTSLYGQCAFSGHIPPILMNILAYLCIFHSVIMSNMPPPRCFCGVFFLLAPTRGLTVGRQGGKISVLSVGCPYSWRPVRTKTILRR